MLFPADRTTKSSHAINTMERRKHAIPLRIQGSIESQIPNRGPISVIVAEENRGIHWKTVQHLGTNAKHARNPITSHQSAGHRKNM